MHSTKRIVIDLLSGNRPETIHVVQGDAYSRVVEIDLRQGKKPWAIPDGVSVAVEYIKPDGTKGLYDTLPDGTQAWNTEGNILTLMLAPQMLTANGTVVTQVRVMLGNTQLSLVKFSVYVHQKITGAESEDYINWRSAFLPQVEGAKVGQYFEVAEVDDAGRATKVIAVDAPQGGSVDIPTKLPNPHALTINGTTYDGSEAVSVEIPQGGGGEWELLSEIELTEPVKTLLIDTDSKGNPLKLKRFYAYFELYSPADTASGNINVNLNRASYYPSGTILFVATNANGRAPWVYFDAEKLWLFRQNDGWTNNPAISAPVTTMTHLAAKTALEGKEFVESILVSAPTALIAGTKVTIWGVKA